MPLTVFTIGYEGWGFDLWVDTLREHGVRTVVDVRELPLSRRPGWSKKALAEKLAERGVGYVHMRRLGSPAPLRHALRDGGLTFAEFAPQFRALLAEREEDLDALLALARSQPVALMCWEEDPARCHRSLVAEALVERSEEPIEVVDIRRLNA
jgi:uncharacterized protein (DUF488 family)